MPYRLKIQTDIQPTGAYYYRDEHLHRAFWGARHTVPDQLKTPQTRAAYSHRCFSVLVSWYAVMSQAVARDRAINMLSTASCTKDGLTSIILYQLSIISPVFRLPGFEKNDIGYMDSLESICKSPPSPSLPVSRPERTTKRLSRRKSAFIRLPTEIHIHIYSFLPLPWSLFSVTLVCKRLHDICTDLIYRDPLGVNCSQGLTPNRYQIDTCRDRLADLLDQRQDLANKLRAFPVAFEDNKPPHDIDIACLAPFRWSSAKELTTLGLYVRQTPFFLSPRITPLRTLHGLLQDIARLCPNLSSLRINVVSGGGEVPSNKVLKDLSTATYSTTLKRLSISAQGSEMPVCLSPMVSSASSLTYVNLDIADLDIDVRSLPVCPNAKRVGLRISRPAIEVQQLLQKSFHTVEDLSVERCSLDIDPHPVDFSLSSPSLAHLLVTFYIIGRLPPTLQSLCVRGAYDFEHFVIPPTPSVHALCLEVRPSAEGLKALGTSFPSTRSLQIGNTYDSSFSTVSNLLFPLKTLCRLIMHTVKHRFPPSSFISASRHPYHQGRSIFLSSTTYGPSYV